MRTRPKILVRTAAVLAAVALVAGACGGGDDDGALKRTDEQVSGTNDINPLPREAVADGGDLRWPLDALPDNFNYFHLNGANGETDEVLEALMPGDFRTEADASFTIDADYFVSIELTGEQPQQLTYTLRPEATWDDGTPITWRDLEAQWKALNGTDDAFVVASTTGYEDIASVTRGVDDKQAIVTFARPFAEWKGMFEHLFPRSTTSDPEVFNTGWLDRPLVTAGPFRLANVDRTAQTITLVRNEKWWGEPAKLNRIIFRVVDRAALADALANNEIDFYEIGSDVNLFARARGIPGVVIRQAVEPRYSHITLSSKPGSPLAEQQVRQAVLQGLNRQAITDAMVGPIAPDTEPLNNFLFVQGSKDYVDHSGPLAYNPDEAGRKLDEAGWTRSGAGTRAKAGKQLEIEFLATAENPVSDRISKLVQNQLGQLGIKVRITPVPPSDLFDEYIHPGNFEMTGFIWVGTPTPITSSRAIYTLAGGQNYGKIGNQAIDDLFAEAISDLDDASRTAKGQRIDELIWDVAPQIPLYQSPGAYAVRGTLANFGARGFADRDYVNMGYAR